MKWNWRLGKWFGIQVHLHVTFIVFFGALILWGMLTGQPAQLGQVLTISGGVFLLAILHEGAHAFVASRFGIKTLDMILLPFAGASRLERRPATPFQAFCIALAGPIINLLIGSVLFIILSFQGGEPVRLAGQVIVDWLVWLAYPIGDGKPTPGGAGVELMELSLLFGLINLLPAYPLDGGPALRAFLSAVMPAQRATRVAARTASFIAWAIVIIGLLTNNYLIAALGFFIFLSGRQESAVATARLMLEGLEVRAAMTTQYLTLATFESLEYATSLLLHSTQQDFPVVGDDGRFLGMLSRQDLLRELSQRGPSGRVIDASRRGVRLLSPGEKLAELFDQFSGLPPVSMPVVEEEKLIGLLNADGIQKLLLVRDVLGVRDTNPNSKIPK
ncbi:MAG: site-2 protease family protein [Planctomycetota bacterium]